MLASAFSTELGRLRDAGSEAEAARVAAAATAPASSTAGGEGGGGVSVDGPGETKIAVSRLRCRSCLRFRSPPFLYVFHLLSLYFAGSVGVLHSWVVSLEVSAFHSQWDLGSV